ncbi:MAG: pseudouridine synthase [Acetivibrionales bacterium]|jgi:16S rRNA pseudouridine516 synthase|nr:rRNA pseudouridine synthase [Clostridiaceae bacterium]
MAKLRLDKYLRDQGIATRSEIKDIIKKGRVKVNNAQVKNPGTHVNTELDIVEIDGEQIAYRKFVYYMLNKPKGLITATEDESLETVLDLFPTDIKLRNVFPVGRLDRNTEGLLIITNDGVFAHNLLSPKKKVKKLYEAVLDNFPGDEAIKAFEKGVDIGEGYVTLPATLDYISTNNPVIARVEIYEGKFHQVKRMFKAVGATVLELKRLRMGNLWLDERLAPGEFRELRDDEIELF